MGKWDRPCSRPQIVWASERLCRVPASRVDYSLGDEAVAMLDEGAMMLDSIKVHRMSCFASNGGANLEHHHRL